MLNLSSRLELPLFALTLSVLPLQGFAAEPRICTDPVGAAAGFGKARAKFTQPLQANIRALLEKVPEGPDGDSSVPQSKALDQQLIARMPQAPGLLKALAEQARAGVTSWVKRQDKLDEATRSQMAEDLSKTRYATPLQASNAAELSHFPAIDLYGNVEGLYAQNSTGYRKSTEAPRGLAVTGNRWVVMGPWFPLLLGAGNMPEPELKVALFFALAHEYAHSIDAVKNFAAFQLCDSQSGELCRNYTPAWMPWLERFASQYEAPLSKLGERMSSIPLAAIFSVPEGGDLPNPATSILWAEMQADMIAAETLAKSELFLKLAPAARERALLLTLTTLITHPNDARRRDGEEGHPHGFERVEYLVTNHPGLRAALGCTSDPANPWIGL